MKSKKKSHVYILDDTVSVNILYNLLKRLNVQKTQNVCDRCPGIVPIFMAAFEKKSFEAVENDIDPNIVAELFSRVSHDDITTMQNTCQTISDIGRINEIGQVIMTKWLQKFEHYRNITIQKVRDLKTLSLDGYNLHSLPREIGTLTNLQGMYLQRNNITSIIVELTHLKNLRHLDMSSNSLTYVPTGMQNMHSLTYCDLRNNKLKSVPKELCELEKLEVLNLNGNPIVRLPKELERIKEVYVSVDNIEFE